jgi:hypothetical protein
MTGYPLGEAPDDRERYSFTVARLGAAQSVRSGDLKLAFNWSGGLRFYDLAVDPEEAVDAYDPADPRVAELWSSLGPRVRMAQPLAPEFPIRWPEELPTPP